MLISCYPAGPRPVESKILGRFLPKFQGAPTAQAQKKKADQLTGAGGDRLQAEDRVLELMMAALKV